MANETLFAAGKVVIYTTQLCGFCHAAKRMLQSKGVDYREVPADGDDELRSALVAATKERTVPQIWLGEHHVGGYTDLVALDRSGELDNILASLSQ